MRSFEVTTSTDGGVATVTVDGELDIATAPVLDEALVQLQRSHSGLVLLDLARVRFLDSSGLRTLLGARRRAQESGRRLRLANLQPDVERVFEVTGVARMFDVATAA